MKIFLIGLPGSGKTTFGKELSAATGRAFVDLDAEIEKEAGKSVQEIFASEGEDNFRKRESTLLKKWCELPENFVMATGGGTPCFSDNLDLLKKSGLTIFLNVPVYEIVRRLQENPSHQRPLLNSDDLAGSLNNLRKDRIKIYQKATLTLSDPNPDVGQLLQLITL